MSDVEGTCPVCGGVLPDYAGVGRRATYCSDYCRHTAWVRRHGSDQATRDTMTAMQQQLQCARTRAAQAEQTAREQQTKLAGLQAARDTTTDASAQLERAVATLTKEKTKLQKSEADARALAIERLHQLQDMGAKARDLQLAVWDLQRELQQTRADAQAAATQPAPRQAASSFMQPPLNRRQRRALKKR